MTAVPSPSEKDIIRKESVLFPTSYQVLTNFFSYNALSTSSGTRRLYDHDGALKQQEEKSGIPLQQKWQQRRWQGSAVVSVLISAQEDPTLMFGRRRGDEGQWEIMPYEDRALHTVTSLAPRADQLTRGPDTTKSSSPSLSRPHEDQSDYTSSWHTQQPAPDLTLTSFRDLEAEKFRLQSELDWAISRLERNQRLTDIQRSVIHESFLALDRTERKIGDVAQSRDDELRKRLDAEEENRKLKAEIRRLQTTLQEDSSYAGPPSSSASNPPNRGTDQSRASRVSDSAPVSSRCDDDHRLLTRI